MGASDHLNPSQFFHGTRHTFSPGQELTPEGAAKSRNYGLQSSKNHVYMTSDVTRAHRFAANDETSDDYDRPHVYNVSPVGHYEEDPHDKSPSFRTTKLVVNHEVKRNWTPEEYAQSEWK